jgi:hypothetical protein
MREIADWLEKLGMPEYAERFAENDIDFAILSDLTDQDFEKNRRCLARTSPQTTSGHCRSQGRQEERIRYRH